MEGQAVPINPERDKDLNLLGGYLRRAQELLTNGEHDYRMADHVIFLAGVLRDHLRLPDESEQSVEIARLRAALQTALASRLPKLPGVG
jgi:hypothetical protein